MAINRKTGEIFDRSFPDIVSLLQPGDLLVANESRVVPARLFGQVASGAEVELLLIRPNPDGTWECMARPGRKLTTGVEIGFSGGVIGRITRVRPDGRRDVEFSGSESFNEWLSRTGKLPIPPYIKQYPDDPERYQTVYSNIPGSIAAPTAGLHFTPGLLRRLGEHGVDFHTVTLHVGPGTFTPVREDSLDLISLEPERAAIGAESAAAIAVAKHDGRRVIAVGTTTTRTLEGVARLYGEVREWSGDIDLLIKPPFDFQVIDGLITNFHLPKSTLLMLVSAFAGREHVFNAYRHAIALQYRFYSFGDAMLIM